MFVDAGFPQMGFTITDQHGTMHVIHFHKIGQTHCESRNGADYLRFTHDGLAVTIEGGNLRHIARALAKGTVDEIRPPDGRPLDPDCPVTIIRVEITDLTPQSGAGRGYGW